MHEEKQRMTMRIIMPIIPVTAFLTALPPLPFDMASIKIRVGTVKGLNVF
ncbi:MAG: hypothetical protein IJR97_07500 [Clostridia bacterium]|nr:hypothetical protein [Clostridia bacterium]